MYRYRAAYLTLSKHVMSVMSYNAKCLVYNYCTSNSFHRWANQGMECWAGPNPAISVLPHELLPMATAALVWDTRSQIKHRWKPQAVATYKHEVCQIAPEHCAEWKPNTLYSEYMVQHTVQLLCFSKSSGINLSH